MNSAKRITETLGESGWKTAVEEKTEKEMESTESQLLHAQRCCLASELCVVKYILRMKRKMKEN